MPYPVSFTEMFVQTCQQDLAGLKLPQPEVCQCVNHLFQKEVPYDLLMQATVDQFVQLFSIFLNYCATTI